MTPSPPQRALRHPLWWTALAVLIVNDHFLKGAGLLPGLVTGKLSDVAGLIVAPMLLATWVRAHTSGARLMCHLAVAGVFGAIQMSTTAGLTLNAVLSLVGVHWQIWPDPWDLACLPAVAISWFVLAAPAMPAASLHREREPAGRLVQAAAIGLGSVFCIATSQAEPEPTCCFAPAITAGVYVHNSAGTDVVVRQRALDPTVSIDCEVVATDPARMLADDALFAPAQTWTVPEWTTLPVGDTDPERGCHAVRLAGGQLDDALVFWRDLDFPAQTVDGYLDRELGAELPPGGILLERGDDDVPVVLDDQGQDLLVTPVAPQDRALPGERCEVPGDEMRLAWSEPLPRGRQRILGVEPGPDDCLAVDLADLADDREQRWYVCLPVDAWPFSLDAVIEVEALDDDAPARGLIVTRESVNSRTTLVLARDAGPSIRAASDLVTVAPVPDTRCALLATPGCGTLTQRANLQVAARGATRTVAPGRSTRIDEGSLVLEIFAVIASTRPVVAPACSGGPADAGDDVELVIVRREVP